MELGRALSQISEIHGHLDRAEVYRGLRPAPVAFTGLLALAAAALEPRLVAAPGDLPVVAYWLAVAAASLLACGADLLFNYAFREDATARRRTRGVIALLAPCLAAGAVITAAVALARPDAAGLLPGLWALVYFLGLFAVRPRLPRATGLAALFYLAAGAALLALPSEHAFGPGMGLAFGIGQLWLALVMHRNVERRTDAGA